jgi:CshA-type fibril repeat protein
VPALSSARPSFRRTGWLAAVLIAATCVQLPVSALAAAPAPKTGRVHVAAADPGPTTTTLGDNFWLAFPTNLFEGGGAGNVLYLSGVVAGTGTVAIPGANFSQDFTVTPGEVSQVRIPFEDSVTASDGVQPLGIHVTADTDISVYGVNQQPTTSGAYLALPVEALGTRYRALGYQGLLYYGAPSQLTVVASASATTLTITPQTDLNGHPAGIAFDVSLDAGDVYQLQGSGGTREDVTGTVIESNIPVAVFGGAVCANVPADATACDHLVQQLTPTSAWGKNFLTVRFATRPAGDTYRVLANEDNTEVSVNDTPVATINAGEFYEAVLPSGASATGSEGTYIHTSHPALVAQYGNGSDYDASVGDPMMMLVPPAGQYLDHYTVAAPDVAGYSPYANLVVPTTDIGQVTLDGTLVDSSLFSPISGSTYSGAQFPLSAGTHTISGPDRFGVQLYEWGDYDGFGFPGGMAMSLIYVDPQAPLTAPDLTSTAPAPNAQQATVIIPEGGSVTLVNGELEVDDVVVSGMGEYSLQPDTGIITFTPTGGYTGIPDPVTYQITDSTGRTARATYSPAVTRPDAPSPADITAHGTAEQPPTTTVDIPAGGTVVLMDGDSAVTSVVQPGQGTYVLDPDTGVITFTPVSGFVATADPVTFRVVDRYGQHGEATFTATVDAYTGPTPADLQSTGTGTAPQSVTIAIPQSGSVTLLAAGQPADTVTRPGVGTYALDATTGVLTFTAVFGYSGSPDPVTFQVTDRHGQTGTATYSPTVNAPEPPSASDRSSSGVGTSPQGVTITPPDGGSIALVNGENLTTEIVVAGVGTYELDPATGTISFVADAGFSGHATAATYRLTDAYGQTSSARYVPTVSKPARPEPGRLATHGGPGQQQTIVVAVPPGGRTHLLDAGGQEADTVVVAGQGTYSVNPETGVLTFGPANGFTGRADGVGYRVTDAYGQSGHSRYTPTVTAVVIPASKLTVTGPALARLTSVHPALVHTLCTVQPGRASTCKVTLSARVNGDITVIGHGMTRSSVAEGRHNMNVVVRLTTLGRALAARPGGVQARIHAIGRVSGTGSVVVDSATTRIVTKVTHIARAVHFVTSSSTLRAVDKTFLDRLRPHLSDTRIVLCQGFTDNRGSAASGMKLGLERAKAACAFLVQGTSYSTRVISYGEARPMASNATAHGRWLNRRAEIVLEY